MLEALTKREVRGAHLDLREKRRQRATATAGLLGLVFASGVWLVLHFPRVGWINPDGAGYLLLARGIRSGHGFALPDGSLPGTRGPGYPVWLALGSMPWGALKGQSALLASRLVLPLNAALVVLLVRRFRKPLWIAGVAGLAALLQPWPLDSGGLYLVPDALAAAFVLGSLTVIVTMESGVGMTRWRWALGVALLAFGVATKESALAGFGVAGAYLVLRNRRSRLLRVSGLFGLFGILFIGEALTLGRPPYGLADLGRLLQKAIERDVYARVPGWLTLIIVGVGVLLAIWCVVAIRDNMVLLAAALATAGVALLLYATLRGFAARNGLLIAYGLPLALASILGHSWSAQGRSHWLRPSMSVIVVVIAVTGNSLGYRYFGNVPNAAERSWDVPAVRAVAAWLAEAGYPRVMSTFYYAAMLQFYLGSGETLRIAPMYSTSLRSGTLSSLSFNEQVSWLGHKHALSPEGMPLCLTASDEAIGAVFRSSLVDALRSDDAQYLIVSGNGRSAYGTFDGGYLLPYVMDQVGLKAVFGAGRPEGHWLVVFRVDNVELTSSSVVFGPARVFDKVGVGGDTRAEVVTLSDYRDVVARALQAAESG